LKILPPVKILFVVVENTRPLIKKLDALVVENARPALEKNVADVVENI